MGEDPGSADAGRGGGAGLRAGGAAARSAAGSAHEAGERAIEHSASGLTEAQLAAWGERIGAEATRPLVLALSGELGAGKSVLARAVATGAGVSGHMPSPTFNLVYRYDTERGPVLHLDLYRLNKAEEVWELGWSELGEVNDIVLIEWPERAAALLPADRWDIRIEPVEGDVLRRNVRALAVGSPHPLPPPERS